MRAIRILRVNVATLPVDHFSASGCRKASSSGGQTMRCESTSIFFPNDTRRPTALQPTDTPCHALDGIFELVRFPNDTVIVVLGTLGDERRRLADEPYKSEQLG